MLMPNRHGAKTPADNHRYGYQGSESDDEVHGTKGTSYTTHFRQLDTRIGRWLSIDPKSTAWESPYVSMGNNPVWKNDQLGDTIKVNSEVAKSKGFQTWKNSKAGKKFYKRYEAGGKRGKTLVEFTYFGDPKSGYGGAQTNGASSGETAAFIKNKSGKIKNITDPEQFENLKGKSDGQGREYSTNLKGGDLKIQVRLPLQSLSASDGREIGETILHETQHVRLYDYQKQMFGKVVLTNSNQHDAMKANYNNSVLINGKPYKIYDFRAERWNYWKEKAKPGETDKFRDKKSTGGFGIH